MFFILLCILLWTLFAFKSPMDPFGWLMLVGLGWFLGFLDGQRSLKKGPTKDSTMPPDEPQ